MAKKILIIDHNDEATRLLSQYLKDNGCIVDIARTAAEACRIAKDHVRTNTVHDLICLDSHVGTESGRAIIRRLRVIRSPDSSYGQVPIMGGFVDSAFWATEKTRNFLPKRKKYPKGGEVPLWPAEEILAFLDK